MARERLRPIGNLRRGLRPLGQILRAIYSRRRDLLFDFDLRDPLPGATAGIPVEFRSAGPADIAAFLDDPAHEVFGRIARRCREQLASGEPFLVGVVGGRIVYHAWAVRRTWRIAGHHRIEMGKGKAVILGCHTIEGFRGRGIYPAALVAQLGLLRQMGVARAFINCNETNLASVRGIQKAGFRRIGSFETVRRAGRVNLVIGPGPRQALESDAPP